MSGQATLHACGFASSAKTQYGVSLVGTLYITLYILIHKQFKNLFNDNVCMFINVTNAHISAVRALKGYHYKHTVTQFLHIHCIKVWHILMQDSYRILYEFTK